MDNGKYIVITKISNNNYEQNEVVDFKLGSFNCKLSEKFVNFFVIYF